MWGLVLDGYNEQMYVRDLMKILPAQMWHVFALRHILDSNIFTNDHDSVSSHTSSDYQMSKKNKGLCSV